MNFYIYPTSEGMINFNYVFELLSFKVVYSVIPEEDTAILTVDTDPKVDGSFHYSLDDNSSFQPCKYDAKYINM